MLESPLDHVRKAEERLEEEARARAEEEEARRTTESKLAAEAELERLRGAIKE